MPLVSGQILLSDGGVLLLSPMGPFFGLLGVDVRHDYTDEG